MYEFNHVVWVLSVIHVALLQPAHMKIDGELVLEDKLTESTPDIDRAQKKQDSAGYPKDSVPAPFGDGSLASGSECTAQPTSITCTETGHVNSRSATVHS